MRVRNKSLHVVLTLGVLAAVWGIPAVTAGAEIVVSDETTFAEITSSTENSLNDELTISTEGQELLTSGYTPGDAATKVAKEELLEDVLLSLKLNHLVINLNTHFRKQFRVVWIGTLIFIFQN